MIFILTILLDLTLAFDRTDLSRTAALSIEVLSSKKTVLQFFKKALHFSEYLFQSQSIKVVQNSQVIAK